MTNSIEKRLDSLLSQMTLDEKLAQIGSYWIFELQTTGKLDPQKIACRLKNGIGQVTRAAGASTLDPVRAARAANQLQKFLVEQTRLGIPAIVHEECCCGAMVLGGTVFPQMIGLASTFRPELAEEMCGAIRVQLRAIGAHQGLSPVLDVGRDPRWGRVEETFGEDPTLVSHFGAAYVRGLQGKQLSEGVMATGKHFIGHSLSLGGLNCAPAQIGKNDLYNVYLAPFQAAVRDAGLASIMNAYPELDGEVVAASRSMLTDLLRGSLGFNGLLVSDYEAVQMLHTYHYAAADKFAAARMAMNAGIDVELPSVSCYGEELKAALDSGQVCIETVDMAVRRHLQKKFELGLFEQPYVDEGRVLELFETAEQRALARKIAQESMVLLKNDGLLPLKKTLGVLAVIGPNAAERRNLLGGYSYTAMREYMTRMNPDGSKFAEADENELAQHDVRTISILEGIQRAVSSDTKVLYARGCGNLDEDTAGFDEAVSIASQADAVILVLGDRSGLVPACTTGETRDSVDLRLPGVQEDLARAIVATGKLVAVVLVNGRPLAVPWLAEHANALLEAWLPGEEGGAAVADVLFGDVNPGGKLPISFPRHVGQIPIFYNHKPAGMKSNWYTDYVTEKVTPLFAFGHGLSYTTFEYSELTMAAQQATQGEFVDIAIKVSNSGDAAGDEVVQLYVHQEYASVPRPVKELKGYARVSLQPGESKAITFHLPVDQLAFYNNDLELVLEPGRVQVMLGGSSEDIRLSGAFEIVGAAKMAVAQRVFTTPVTIV